MCELTNVKILKQRYIYKEKEMKNERLGFWLRKLKKTSGLGLRRSGEGRYGQTAKNFF